MASDIQPGLLRKMTVRSIFEKLQLNGPLSRADLTRETGISAPTVSKVVAELISLGFVEETEISQNHLGRPGKRLRTAKLSSRVVGVTIGQFSCGVATAAFDGEVDAARAFNFPTPSNYEAFIALVADCIAKIKASENYNLLGLGICVPGLISHRTQIVVHSDLAPFLIGRALSTDLSQLIGLPVAAQQQGQALAMAERFFGQARWLRDFVMVDVAEGPTLGIYNDGELIGGRDGLAGQLSLRQQPFLTAAGQQSLVTDADFLAAVSRKTNRQMTMDHIWQEYQSGALDLKTELETICQSIGKVMATTINLFNPSNLFLHSRILGFDVTMLSQIEDTARSLSLDASFDMCQIQATAVTPTDAAIAAAVDSLTQNLGPRVG